MTSVDYLALVEADARALAAAASAVAPDAVLPTCPDWTMADLVEHVAGIYHWVEMTVRTRADTRIPREELRPYPPLEDALGRMLATLAEVPPDEPVWNWSINQPKVAGFWPRRMACETAMHRVDAQSALGGDAVAPVDAGLAVDALDELLDVIGPAACSWFPDMSLDGSVHFHCTDVEGEWLVTFGDGVMDVTRAHAKGDAAVRGTASDVLLWAYSRLPLDSDRLSFFGDEAVLGRWQSIVSF